MTPRQQLIAEVGPEDPRAAGDKACWHAPGIYICCGIDDSVPGATIVEPATRGDAMAAARFIERLNEQIAYEFAASPQYIANAVYYDSQTLPRLAAFFSAQAG